MTLYLNSSKTEHVNIPKFFNKRSHWKCSFNSLQMLPKQNDSCQLTWEHSMTSICTPDSGACAGGYIIEILSVSESSLSLFTLHAPIAVLGQKKLILCLASSALTFKLCAHILFLLGTYHILFFLYQNLQIDCII